MSTQGYILKWLDTRLTSGPPTAHFSCGIVQRKENDDDAKTNPFPSDNYVDARGLNAGNLTAPPVRLPNSESETKE